MLGVVLILLAQLPGYAMLEKAYSALRVGEYEAAIDAFRRAAALQPENPAIRKDLAYTLLKIGENEAARDEFAEAARLNPKDDHASLEYAFLCYETGRKAEARRVFDRVRVSGSGEARATAEQAFQNIDQALAEGIARWRQALEKSEDFSAHHELARLAEERDELDLAAAHYEKAWRLKPDHRALLVDLGRILLALGRNETAHAALLAASRGAEPRAAERAREMLPARYPYLYELKRALEFDPDNLELRREIEHQNTSPDARTMGTRSYEAGYLKDAVRYFTIAHETDPSDFPVMLKLGWTYNLMKQDREAMRWFGRARRSPDPAVAAEARRAYGNLHRSLSRVRTTAWLFPLSSSRWQNVFSYGQVKTELRLGGLPVLPYLSTRFIGDVRGNVGRAVPQFLSESAFLFGAGLATVPWRGWTAWAEAGRAVSYLAGRRQQPDYRGGVSHGKAIGRQFGGEKLGFFWQISNDGVFLSRFDNNFLVYSQNRVGFTLPPVDGFQAQIYSNFHVTFDARRQYWANFAEAGPGVRFRWTGLPPSMVFSFDVLRGAHLVNAGNPRRPNYYDVRVGVWYAITR